MRISIMRGDAQEERQMSQQRSRIDDCTRWRQQDPPSKAKIEKRRTRSTRSPNLLRLSDVDIIVDRSSDEDEEGMFVHRSS